MTCIFTSLFLVHLQGCTLMYFSNYQLSFKGEGLLCYLSLNNSYTPIAFVLARLLHCMRVQLRNGYMRACAKNATYACEQGSDLTR